MSELLGHELPVNLSIPGVQKHHFKFNPPAFLSLPTAATTHIVPPVVFTGCLVLCGISGVNLSVSGVQMHHSMCTSIVLGFHTDQQDENVGL